MSAAMQPEELDHSVAALEGSLLHASAWAAAALTSLLAAGRHPVRGFNESARAWRDADAGLALPRKDRAVLEFASLVAALQSRARKGNAATRTSQGDMIGRGARCARWQELLAEQTTPVQRRFLQRVLDDAEESPQGPSTRTLQ